ncbi:hypothetical protein J7J81_01665 [bacterium]|nr:hypothetical protein [bacterium]
MAEKIIKSTFLSELLGNSDARKILVKYKIPCFGCPFAIFEMGKLKLGEVCKAYQINAESLIKELNKALKNKKT